LNRIRKKARKRFPDAEPEDPLDLLDMDVITRNEYWNRRRYKRIDHKRNEKEN
jgi:hypothetical protein